MENLKVGQSFEVVKLLANIDYYKYGFHSVVMDRYDNFIVTIDQDGDKRYLPKDFFSKVGKLTIKSLK